MPRESIKKSIKPETDPCRRNHTMQILEREQVDEEMEQSAPPASVPPAGVPSAVAPLAAARTRAEALTRSFGVLTRIGAALALATPAAAAAAFAWWQTGLFDPLALLCTVVGVVAAALGLFLLSAYHDHRQSAATVPAPDLPDERNAYTLLLRGEISPEVVRSLGLIFLAAGGLCSVLLAILAGWPVVVFIGASFLIAAANLLPPTRLAYRGWGLGELAWLVGFGLLPALGSYYSQARMLGWPALWTALPFALLATLVIYNYHWVYYHRDWLLRKRTLPLILGATRALDLSAALTVAGYAGLLILAGSGRLPLWSLLALGGLPIALGAFNQVHRRGLSPEESSVLPYAAIQAAIVTTALFGLALWLDRAL